MMGRGFVWQGMFAAGLTLLAASAYAQAQAQGTQKPFEPTSGRPGKDVVWVPTPQATVDAMLDVTKVTAKDYLMDLGSGNGITVITAAKRGATALGIEFDPDMLELSKRRAAEAGVAGRATFVKADLFEADLSKATVITLFLLPEINLRLRPKILDLKPGTRVASNTFTMGDWEPDEEVDVKVGECATSSSWCRALYWMVPAKAQGTWQVGQQTLTLNQKYQMVTGTLGSTPISDGRLTGDQIVFTAGGAKYTGRVNGSSIQGTGGPGGSWTATRK
jgi:hypothetical protein